MSVGQLARTSPSAVRRGGTAVPAAADPKPRVERAFGFVPAGSVRAPGLPASAAVPPTEVDLADGEVQVGVAAGVAQDDASW